MCFSSFRSGSKSVKMKNKLYDKEIIEMWKNPKNFGKLKDFTHDCSQQNVVCGDEMDVYLKIKNGIVEKASFFSTGCLICIVFASKLVEKIKGMTVKEILELKNEDLLNLVNLEINSLREKCACLSLEAVQNCLRKEVN